MEQDARTMSLLLSVSRQMREIPKAQIYSANFTEAPGIYIEIGDVKHFVPNSASSAEVQETIEKLRRVSFQ